MKYFLDTEFLEGAQKPLFGKAINTIDLISIGIVSEDERKYYAISKDFNLVAAWHSYQLEDDTDVNGDVVKNIKKVYWLRANVLKSIFHELISQEYQGKNKSERTIGYSRSFDTKFTYGNLKRLLKKYGKSNETIAKEIKNFIYCENIDEGGQIILGNFHPNKNPSPFFYGYYADYDWVVFCWLFGKMINLPKGFPMFCMDLKQIMEHQGLSSAWKEQMCPNFADEHNALNDALWNLKLYKQIIRTSGYNEEIN